MKKENYLMWFHRQRQTIVQNPNYEMMKYNRKTLDRLLEREELDEEPQKEDDFPQNYGRYTQS